MSVGVFLGPQANLLDEKPEHARQLRLEQPILDEQTLAALRAVDEPGIRPATLRTVFRVADGPTGLATSLEALLRDAEHAVREHCGILILSDRDTDGEWAPIPSLLALSAVHHHLGRVGLRADRKSTRLNSS